MTGATNSPWSSSIALAWAIAGTTAGLLGYVAVASLFSDAPGDRAGGVGFVALLGLGLLAAALVRLRRGPMIRVLFGMVPGQVAVALLLVAEGIGAPRVVMIVTAIFATGWAGAAVLMLVTRSHDV